MKGNLKKKLVNHAIAMRGLAHAPFSHYAVGSAVLTEDDSIIGGCNVESSSYGLTCCAERIALYRAIAEGHRNFKALAVATETGGYPCGACRQVIWDLCGNIPIFISDTEGKTHSLTSKELIPNAFDANQLL